MILLTVSRRCFFYGSFFNLCFVFVFIILSSFVVTCWERADLLLLLCVMFSCVLVTFPYGVTGQAWHLLVLIPYICVLPYLEGYFISVKCAFFLT